MPEYPLDTKGLFSHRWYPVSFRGVFQNGETFEPHHWPDNPYTGEILLTPTKDFQTEKHIFQHRPAQKLILKKITSKINMYTTWKVDG